MLDTQEKKATDWIALILLMVAAMVFITAELSPAGMLKEISASLNESPGNVGLIVTSYAWTVSLSAVFLTIWLAAVPKRQLLIGLMLIFAAANFVIAFVDSLSLVLLPRVVAALSHALFWSMVGPLCVRLAGNTSKAYATSFVFGGIAVATVIAVPLSTLLAQQFGWRMVFVILAGISCLIGFFMILRFPKLEYQQSLSFKKFFLVLQHKPMQQILWITVFAISGHFCAFTYVAPLLENNVGIPAVSLAFYLFLFGFAGLLGNVYASRIKDARLSLQCQIVLSVMALAIIALSYVSIESPVLVYLFIILWGAGVCALTIILQSLILYLVENLAEVASATYISIFNIGIGAGALIGGFIIDNASLHWLAWFSGVALLAGSLFSSSKHLRMPTAL